MNISVRPQRADGHLTGSLLVDLHHDDPSNYVTVVLDTRKAKALGQLLLEIAARVEDRWLDGPVRDGDD